MLSNEILVPLYLSLVCLNLDYGTQCWPPYLLKNVQVLEQIQRRATEVSARVGPATVRSEMSSLRSPNTERKINQT